MIVRRHTLTPDQRHRRTLTWLLVLATGLTAAGVSGVALVISGTARGMGLL